ncbi:hypothetical protein HPB47_027563, partial [Ixodes persulcatus]
PPEGVSRPTDLSNNVVSVAVVQTVLSQEMEQICCPPRPRYRPAPDRHNHIPEWHKYSDCPVIETPLHGKLLTTDQFVSFAARLVMSHDCRNRWND